MTVQLCPVCGCSIGDEAYEKEEVTYCCEPCATGEGQCACGCCTISSKSKNSKI